MTDLQPCPMCGSPAKMDSTGTAECYGYAWQTVYVECTKTLDPKCGMELSLQADMFYADNSWDVLIEAWNKLRKEK